MTTWYTFICVKRDLRASVTSLGSGHQHVLAAPWWALGSCLLSTQSDLLEGSMAEASKLRCGLLPTVESWHGDPMGPMDSALPNQHCLASLSCPQPWPSLCRAFALAVPPASNNRKGLPHTLAPASKLRRVRFHFLWS